MTALIGFLLGAGFVVICVVIVVVANQAGEAFARRDAVRVRAQDAGLTFAHDFIAQVEDVAAIDDALPKLTLAAVEGKDR